MKSSLHILKEIISERRTLKPQDYSSEKVDDQFIQQILEQANWAPTHGYTEPWRFVVYKEEGRNRLGEFLAKYDQPDPEAEGFNAQRYQRLADRPMQASHVIGIAMAANTNPKIPEVEDLCAVAMAVQNMWLMSHALGLGAYWSTGKVAFSDEFRNFMGFDDSHQSLGLFYIGKPNRDNPQGRRISGIETKVRWES
jgi:nitroreductase